MRLFTKRNLYTGIWGASLGWYVGEVGFTHSIIFLISAVLGGFIVGFAYLMISTCRIERRLARYPMPEYAIDLQGRQWQLVNGETVLLYDPNVTREKVDWKSEGF